MAYLVTDGKFRKEFQTLEEAKAYYEPGMKIYTSDDFGNIQPVSSEEISKAVAKIDEVPSMQQAVGQQSDVQRPGMQGMQPQVIINLQQPSQPVPPPPAPKEEDKRSFLQKYWLHMILLVMVFVILGVMLKVLYPIFKEGMTNIMSVKP